jgi:hypothetical protein
MKPFKLLTYLFAAVIIIAAAGSAYAQPSVPVPLSPACGDRDVSRTPLIDWSDSHSFCTEPLTYDIDIFVGNDECSDLGIAPLISAQGLTSSQFQVGTSQMLPANTKVCYRIRAHDSCGASAWSECCCFITGN